jgi:hypothetical protein
MNFLERRMMGFVKMLYDIIGPILSILAVIISIVYYIKGINKRSLNILKIRFEIYEKIFTEKNEFLVSTYLKDYLGFSITDGMVKYMLNSTKFNDIVVVLKNIYSYIKPNPENGKIEYKRNPECKMIIFSVLYFVFLIPAFLVLSCFDKLITSPTYLIAVIIIIIPFTIIALIFGSEAGNIKQAMKKMDNL